MKLAIVDYGSGNLRSAAKAFERAARESGLNVNVDVTGDVDAIAGADRVVLPGVGAFRDCLEGLNRYRRHGGRNQPCSDRAPGSIFRHLRRHAANGKPWPRTRRYQGLWLDPRRCRAAGTVNDPTLKIPHMGWNALAAPVADHPVLAGVPPRCPCLLRALLCIAGGKGGACAGDRRLRRSSDSDGRTGNIVGTQFHPEKSQAAGLALIANFLKWEP